jgi:CheY-like chemotaxis protein
VKVLIVDDDPDLRRLLTRFLEKNGCVVFSAGDALQALDTLEREPVNLVITDLMMPHIDGIRFTESLRQDPRHKDLPVIMLTAYPTDEALEQSMRKGVAMTLAKPINFDQLLALVRFAQ